MELSRDDHVHDLATDQTLGFRPTGELFVEVTDVLESLHETVSYYSLDGTAGYDGGGYACQGEEYDLSPYQKTVHKTQIWVGAAEVSGGGYWRAGVFGTDSNGEIDAVYGRSAVKNLHSSNIFNFIFDDVVIPATEGRVAILGCRIDSDGESGSNSRSAHLREGTESAQSPDFSYDDAPDDFSRVHHSRYEHAFPEVGDGRHDHGESTIRGDIKIFYTITYDHGNLVGDGNVGVGHIDSGSADDGDVLTADGSGGAAFEAPVGGGGGGTDTTVEVDAVVLDYTTLTRTLEVDVQQDNGTDVSGSVAFPMATASAPGLTEYATNTEAASGTEANRALTPSNVLSITNAIITDTAVNVTSPASESTIIAASRQAVAEAIAANSGGGGAITQATETALGGVRGATALQAIATSGTDDSRLVEQPRPRLYPLSPP